MVSVFDPCTSKYDQDMQRDVRRLLEQSGLALKELPYSGKTALCCGFGGHIQVANPELTKGIVSKRIELGSEPYITYCTNCRDAFAERGKSCKHLLDVLFNLNDWHRKPPSLTQRRDNRESLKADLLERVWKEEAPGDMGKTELQISAELTEKLNNEFILEDDLRKTVEYCESSGNKLLDAESGCFIGHQKRGYLTYWVVYSIVPGIEGQAYRIMNAYSHRLNIEGE
ncbi:MAG: hypothetical protein HGA22_15265 [Clostridiales bacterium]|nr:hypothetical protein [Clostridiales bacterium]